LLLTLIFKLPAHPGQMGHQWRTNGAWGRWGGLTHTEKIHTITKFSVKSHRTTWFRTCTCFNPNKNSLQKSAQHKNGVIHQWAALLEGEVGIIHFMFLTVPWFHM